MDSRNILNIFTAWRTDPEGARRFRRLHTLPQERFALLFTAVIYALLAAVAFEREDWTTATIKVGAIVLLSALFYLFRPRHFRDGYIHLFSCYYLLIFLLVYYYPLVVGFSPDLRPRGYNYLLHLSILIAQALRPNVRGGVLVLVFLSLHSLVVLHQGADPLDATDLLRFTVFVWLGLVVLYIERLNFLNSFKYFDLNFRKDREREELQLAEQVHKNLFPPFQENDSVRLFARRISPELTGGDFYDLVYLREGNLGLFFTDISGHGISAAMMSAAVKVIVQGMPYRNRMNPSALLTHVDEVMSSEYGSHHASAVYLFLDFQARQARIANAGHPPVLYSRQGEPFVEIESEGALLGYDLRKPIAEDLELPLRQGDRFLFYTDGLLECEQKNGGTFIPGIHEFIDGLERSPADRLVDELLDRVRGSTDFGGFRDDVMIVLLEIK